MDRHKRDGRSGRFVPFNLSTVAPFEATASALAELPLLHTTSPAFELDAQPEDAENRHVPSAQTLMSMVEMMQETVIQK